MITIIHTTRPGEYDPVCGAKTGWTYFWEAVNNHRNPKYFTCGACWKIIAGGLEPMGGSLHRSEAHEEEP